MTTVNLGPIYICIMLKLGGGDLHTDLIFMMLPRVYELVDYSG